MSTELNFIPNQSQAASAGSRHGCERIQHIPSLHLSTTMSQSAIALGLLKSGSLLLTVAFSWGIVIPATPFPRIALSNHLNMIQHGVLSIAAGLILYQKGLVELSEWQVLLVGFSHFYLWPLNVVSICNAWWGTNKTLHLVLHLKFGTHQNSWPKRLVRLEGRLGKKFWLK